MTAVAFTIDGKAVSVEAEPEGAFSPSVSEAYWGDVIPDTYQTAKEFIDKVRTGERSRLKYVDLEELAKKWAPKSSA